MFRKYAAFAASILIASAAHITLAEHARPRAQGATHPLVQPKGHSTTSAGIHDAEMRIIPTQETLFATNADDPSTERLSAATFGRVLSENSDAAATHAPQRTSPGLFFHGEGAASAASPGDDYTTQVLSAQEEKMLNLLNQDRKRSGLSALAADPELSRIARIKSADMRDGGYFAHESPTYGDIRAMLWHFGYAFTAAGENIAHHANVDKAQAAFMSSTGHRAAILSRAWTKVGIGIVTDANGFIYATQIFAR